MQLHKKFKSCKLKSIVKRIRNYIDFVTVVTVPKIKIILAFLQSGKKAVREKKLFNSAHLYNETIHYTCVIFFHVYIYLYLTLFVTMEI